MGYFNVDGAAKGKPGPAGIDGALLDFRGQNLFSFSKFIGFKDSNDAGIVAILEALRMFAGSFQESWIVESNLHNVWSMEIALLSQRNQLYTSLFFFPSGGFFGMCFAW